MVAMVNVLAIVADAVATIISSTISVVVTAVDASVIVAVTDANAASTGGCIYWTKRNAERR